MLASPATSSRLPRHPALDAGSSSNGVPIPPAVKPPFLDPAAERGVTGMGLQPSPHWGELERGFPYYS